jgi:ribosomal protein S18 acetylase RimI-like enzyme
LIEEAPRWALRPAADADRASLASLFRSTRPELAMLPDGLADMLLAQQQQLQALGYRQAFPGAQELIIESAGTPAGRLLLDEQRQHLRVVDIAVLPAFRGRGLARAVLRQLQQDGRDVLLSVPHDNIPARRLYDSLGFKEEARDEVRASMCWQSAQ